MFDNLVTELNNDKTCRTCLKQEKFVISLKPIFDFSMETSFDVPGALSILNLKIYKDDGLPQLICNECVDCLKYLHKFRRLCEESQITLGRFHTADKINWSAIKTETDIEFTEVEFLHVGQADFPTDFILENQLKEEILWDDGRLTCSSVEMNQNDLGDSGVHQENLPNLTSIESNKNALEYLEINGGESRFKCRLCDKIFETIELFDSHMESVHPIKKSRTHMCLICGKGFVTIHSLNIHIESHNQNNDYKCDICGKEFKCKLYMRKHKRAQHTIENHECPHCNVKFDNTVKYKYHLKSHDPDKKYKCKYCDKSFLQHHHLTDHESIHTGLRPYLCNICGKNYRTPHNFKIHLRTHNSDRPYVCSLCGKDFAQRGSYLLHKRQHAGIRPYQCEQCGKNFFQKSSLNVHLRIHTGERPYKCDMCNKCFSQSPQLKYHKIAIHNGLPLGRKKHVVDGVEQSFEESTESQKKDIKNVLLKCNFCTKRFKLQSSLASHMKIHSEERNHVCTECGNSFKRAEHLKVHIKGVHLKQKPHTCEICPKAFFQSGDLNIHMMTHTGEKPHSCPHCSKRFRLQKSLKIHIRIHTGEKPYKCDICLSRFISYNALIIHTTKHPELLLQSPKDNY